MKSSSNKKKLNLVSVFNRKKQIRHVVVNYSVTFSWFDEFIEFLISHPDSHSVTFSLSLFNRASSHSFHHPSVTHSRRSAVRAACTVWSVCRNFSSLVVTTPLHRLTTARGVSSKTEPELGNLPLGRGISELSVSAFGRAPEIAANWPPHVKHSSVSHLIPV